MGEAPLRADIWLAGETAQPEIVLAGVPWSPVSNGVALAPMAMRDRLHRFSTYHSERSTDFSDVPVADQGNWPVTGLDETGLRDYVVERLERLPESSRLNLFVGGDARITPRLLAAYPEAAKSALIKFSCKPPDDYSDLVGHQMVLIGLHTFAAGADAVSISESARAIAITNDRIDKEGVRMTIDRALGKLSMIETIHVSVDVDALDQSQAPGSATSMPGGLTVRQLSEAVRRCGANGKVKSMDFVGADVETDVSNLTIDALSHLVLSAVAGYAERAHA